MRYGKCWVGSNKTVLTGEKGLIRAVKVKDMNFTDGVVALVVIHGKKKICDNSTQVYYFLYDNGIEHELAADAQSWTELACVDETYNEEEFDIYMQ